MKCLVSFCKNSAMPPAPYCRDHDRVITTVYVEPDVKSRDILMEFVRYCEDRPEMEFGTAIKSFLYDREVAV